MEHQNIQPFILKTGNYVNDQPNGNGPNYKLKHLYNDVKSTWMIKYGTTKFLSHHTKSILVESWGTFKGSAGNIIRGIFVKKKIPPLSPTELTKNIQACDASYQVPYGAKYE